MAFDIKTLITDRGPGTFYNVSDLNRVGEAVRYLAKRFTDYGYAVAVSPKADWSISIHAPLAGRDSKCAQKSRTYLR